VNNLPVEYTVETKEENKKREEKNLLKNKGLYGSYYQ